jgi:DNA-binding beta-propeller fold protein YncE
MKSGARTGYVLRWRAGKGIDKLPGSESCLPNGVIVSADGRTVFIAESGAHRVTKLDYASGRTLGHSATVFPDNLTWAPDGRVIFSNVELPTDGSCDNGMDGCVKSFSVMAIEPNTLAMTTLYRQQGLPMASASVALVHDGYLYIGSFEGDRLIRAALKNTGYGAPP